MKLSELKSIIMECIEEMDEGVRRMNRVNNSKKFNSRSSKEWRKADLAFDTAAKKVARRNEKGIAKYGQVKFSNARLNGKKPVQELNTEIKDKKYPPVGVRQNLKKGQPLRVTSPTGGKVKWDSKARKWIDESGPARKNRRSTGYKKQDVTHDILASTHTLNRKKRDYPNALVSRSDGTITFDRQHVSGLGKVEGPFGTRKYRGSFKNLGKGKIK